MSENDISDLYRINVTPRERICLLAHCTVYYFMDTLYSTVVLNIDGGIPGKHFLNMLKMHLIDWCI